MRKSLKGFYDLPNDSLSEIWSSDSTLFILDTNILLSLYQYSLETRSELLKVLGLVQGRIWIPFHVALEYQRRRLDVVRNEKLVFANINKKLSTIQNMVSRDFSEFDLKARNTALFDLEERFKKDLFSLIDSFKAEVDEADKAQPCVRSDDVIRAQLDVLLEGKVGVEPSDEWVLDIAKQGIVRYANKVPPGYEDVNKEKDTSKASFTFNGVTYERKYGDLIIWKQIIEHVKEQSGITNVIFITDDSKEDWWEIINSRGDKTIGARPELRSEIHSEAGVENFKMYHTNDFLAAAKVYCDVSVDDKAIEETGFLLNNWELKNLLNENASKLNLNDTYHEILARFSMGIPSIGLRDSYDETVDTLKATNQSLSIADSYSQALANLKMTDPSRSITDSYSQALTNLQKANPSLSNEDVYRELLSKINKHKSESKKLSVFEEFLESIYNHKDDE